MSFISNVFTEFLLRWHSQISGLSLANRDKQVMSQTCVVRYSALSLEVEFQGTIHPRTSEKVRG